MPVHPRDVDSDYAEALRRAKRVANECGRPQVIWEVAGKYEIRDEGMPPASALRVARTVVYPKER